jgi:hypothetical protein
MTKTAHAFWLLAGAALFTIVLMLAAAARADAQDAGAGPGPAAATVGVEPTQPSILAPDPVDDPGSAWTLGRITWQRGGWQFAIVLCWVLSAFVVKRMEPGDEDHDGRPDAVGWKGKTWAIAFGLLAVLGPAAAVALGAPGAAWAGVLPGVPVLIAAVMDVANPKRGAAKAVV